VGHANSRIETPARAEIQSLVNQHPVTADHALEVLARLPASASPDLRHAIGTAMCAVMTDARGRLLATVDEAIGVLSGVAAHGDAGVQIALGARSQRCEARCMCPRRAPIP